MVNIKAVILVGGYSRGTRFRPLTLNQPKPLFPVAGYPMIYHHVAALSKLEGMKEIYLLGFYEPQLFANFISAVKEEFGVNIRYLREYESLGTGGGLFHFREQILRGNPDFFFFLHGDVCCSFPVQEMLDFHKTHNGICTLLTTKVSRNDSVKYGCVVADPQTNAVMHYVEKPETFVSDLISCGVFIFRPTLLADIKQMSMVRSRSMEDLLSLSPEMVDHLRLEQDILAPLAGSGKLFMYQSNSFWSQIKTGSSALVATTYYLDHFSKNDPTKLAASKENGPTIVGSVFIHPTAVVHPTAKIGPNVTIGARVTISEGVRVRDSIILDDVDIKKHCCILFSIIGWKSRIGSWTRIEGSPNKSDAGVTVNGVKTQSATILAEDVRVDDELIVRNCVVLPHKDIRTSYRNEILL